VGVAGVEEPALVLDEDDAEDDAELLVDGVPDRASLVAVEDGAAEELSPVGVTGAVGVGEDGAGVVVPEDDEELPASSPRVVVPADDELLTSADTGFCPTSSIPVTIAIATANTETA